MSKPHTILFLISIFIVALAQDDWVLHWSDEFNGTEIDTTKWTFENGNGENGWGNQELQYYTGDSSNAFIEDGKLVIQANKEEKGGFQYTSARMKTAGKFATVYGRFEAKVKLPTGKGMWPSFWLLGANFEEVGWPACGEIDIFEWLGRDPDYVHFSTHGTGFDTTDNFTKEGGWDDGNFHTFAVNWQPDYLDFYADDELVAKVTPDNLTDAEWPFNDHDMYIILNLAVGGEWPGSPDDSTEFPQQYIVEYVRVYEKVMPDQEKAPVANALFTTKTGRRICKKRSFRI